MSVADPYRYRRGYSAGEFWADACVHGLGLVFGILGGSILVLVAGGRGDWARVSAIFVYVICLVVMFAASALYNITYGSRLRWLFRRLDHSAIFLLIAGTYTPFTTQLHDRGAAIVLTGTIWTLCALGVALKFRPRPAFERVSDWIYLALGWASVPVIWPIAPAMGTSSLVTLAAGGALYTLGVVFHRWEDLRFHNAIWHVFVLAAAACQYVSVLTGVALTSA